MRQPVKKSAMEKKNTTGEQIKLYSTISPLLWAAFNEVKEFSKKKQDEQLNLKKVKMINRLLEKAKVVLENEPTVDFLDMLDEDLYYEQKMREYKEYNPQKDQKCQ